jgi:glycosyltransferase involved in cell wall biosynthesis
VTYFGRFATYKNPDKLRFLYNASKEKGYDFKFAMHGIDRSIGSKTSIIDLEEVKYHNNFNGEYEGELIDVYGHYLPEDAAKFMGRNLFGYNGYNFSKMPHNYVYRLEYAQMEIMSAGCIPIFHKNLGESVKDTDGNRMIDYPNLAIWYQENENENEVLELMEEISKNEDLYNKYILAGKNFIEKYNDTEQSMENLLDCMSEVKINRTDISTFLDNIYYKNSNECRCGKQRYRRKA